MKIINRPHLALVILGFVAPLILYLVYHPSLLGKFVFDDDVNIASISFDHEQSKLTNLWLITLGNESGPFGRPVAMLTFALQIITTGLDPYPMKWVNLIIHWGLGIILFFLSHLLLSKMTALSDKSRSWMSLVITAVWLFHPFNLTSVAYIVQRMNSLSAFFVATAVLLYSRQRMRQQNGSGLWLFNLLFIALCGVLAVLSKENALLLPIYLFVVEYCCFNFQAIQKRDQIVVRLIFLVILVIPIVLILIKLLVEPSSIIGSYQNRPFTLVERSLTECRVLVWYLFMLITPNINQMTLYHDGIILSTSLFSPLTTLFSAIIICLLLCSAALLRRAYPWFSFGILWFFSGHLLESTIFPLELVYEHRNYLPGFGIIFSAVTGGAVLLNRLEVKIKSQGSLTSIVLTLLAINTHTLAYRWSDSDEAILLDAQHHPESPRANIFAGTTYGILAKRAQDGTQKKHLFSQAEHHFQQSYNLTPSSTNALFGWLFLYYNHQLAPPDKLVIELEEKLKTSIIEATTINGLHKLTQCQINKFCKLSDTQYLSMMDATFSNPALSKQYSTAILRDLSTFYSQNKNDYKTAILLTKKALEITPSSGVRLDLVYYFVNAGYLQNALNELKTIEANDNLGMHQGDIKKWRQLISIALSSSVSNQ